VFAIVISEKGGAERREVFDRTEITVGRVQGNELMLPKGNVSKRHARLIFRDSRFIVTDLNSTNGTYVNRRRITQATLVREGDRIYIGDFVLRIEVPEGAGENLSTDQGNAGRGTLPSVDRVPVAALAEAAVSEGEPREGAEAGHRASAHSAPAHSVPVASSVATPLLSLGASSPHAVGPSPTELASLANRGGRPQVTRALTELDRSLPEHSEPGIVPPPRVQTATGLSDPGLGSPLALLERVVERVVAQLDPSALDAGSIARSAKRVRHLVEEVVAAAAADLNLEANTLERLKRDAYAELVELGPLGELLARPNVSDILVVSWDRIYCVEAGHRAPHDLAFTSTHALQRVIARLCERADRELEPGEQLVERRLPDGTAFWAALGDAAPGGPVLVLRRSAEQHAGIDDLVRSGALSPAASVFLQQCVVARLNVLVVGPREPLTTFVAGSLASCVAEEPWFVLEDSEPLAPPSLLATRLAVTSDRAEGSRLARLALGAPGARVLVELGSRELSDAVVEAASAGAHGVIGVVRASSLRRGLLRVASAVAACHPALSALQARDFAATAFDLAVEVGPLRDGRARVLRISELGGADAEDFVTHEIFGFVVERTDTAGHIEGQLAPTGTLPHVLEELQAHGIRVDRSIFNPRGAR
jgi:pilus assembly protein CpaF